MKSPARQRSLIATLIVLLFPIVSYADASDTEARIQELQKQVQQMSEARAEQDKQIELLTKELVGIENQVSQSKITRTEERGSSKGNPVFAVFKDGVSLEDGSGNWKLALNGRIQADYREFSPDVDGADTFSLRRARLGGTLTMYMDYVARVEGEYSGGSTTLTYGYIDINKFQTARFRLGQFKPYYGLERTMSTNFTDFQERSLADSLLGSTYDRGVMIFGNPISGFNYSLAYVNGTGTTDENNAKSDGKDLTLRLTGNLAEFEGWTNSVVHVGGFYADGNEGSRRQAGFIPIGQTEARGAQFFNTTCSAGAAVCGTAAAANAFKDDVKRTRAGLETALAYGPVKFQSEFIDTSFEGPGYDRDINAWYASAVWNVSGESFASMYKEGVFGRLIPKNNYKSGTNGRGALQVGVRYSKFDAFDFKKTGNAAGTGVLLNVTPTPTTADGLLVATNEADAWTLGANWILQPNFRFVGNWVHTSYQTPIRVRVNGKDNTIADENALTLRAQYDF